jgi:hypothetical protein
MKVINGPASAKNEVSQETLDRWQREDNARRAKTMSDDQDKKGRENNGDKR